MGDFISAIQGLQCDVECAGLLIQAGQIIVLVIGIPLLILQIREQTKAAKLQAESFRLSAYLEMMAVGSRVNEMILDDPGLEDFFNEEHLPEELEESWWQLPHKYRRYYLYLGRRLSSMEQAFILWTRDWMDDVDYRATILNLFDLVRLRIFALWWPEIRPYFREDFSAYVESLRGKNREGFFAAAMIRPGSSRP
jgi:hypothetical protein